MNFLSSQQSIKNLTFIVNTFHRVDRRDMPTQFNASRCHATLAPLHPWSSIRPGFEIPWTQLTTV
jgi:hypothetical protein